MKVELYKQLLEGIEQALVALDSSDEYQKLEKSQHYPKHTGLKLIDAIEVLNDVIHSVNMVELYELKIND